MTTILCPVDWNNRKSLRKLGVRSGMSLPTALPADLANPIARCRIVRLAMALAIVAAIQLSSTVEASTCGDYVSHRGEHSVTSTLVEVNNLGFQSSRPAPSSCGCVGPQCQQAPPALPATPWSATDVRASDRWASLAVEDRHDYEFQFCVFSAQLGSPLDGYPNSLYRPPCLCS